MDSVELLHLIIPLGRDAHHLAEQFAAQQATLLKGRRVYLNTLAVYAVHSYLQWRQVETDLTQGDSWHPGLRAVFDVADLVLPGIGKLECRPVLSGETAFRLPLEVMEDRIGYVAVQFNELLDQVRLLGFAGAIAPHRSPEELQVTELKPLDGLIDYVHQVAQDAARALPIQQTFQQAAVKLVNLHQWFQSIFETDWQPIELVVAPNFRSTAEASKNHPDPTHSSVSRAKVIDLGTQLVNQAVVLVMRLTSKTPEEVAIRLRLYPADDSIYLPPNLQITVLDASEITCIEAKARSADSWIQLEFGALPEEQFSVRLALGEVCINERFVV